MHVQVNGTRLWFDVDGPGLVPEGDTMRERPTVVLLRSNRMSHIDPGGRPERRSRRRGRS